LSGSIASKPPATSVLQRLDQILRTSRCGADRSPHLGVITSDPEMVRLCAI
jgi:hypothetical protein